MSEQKADYSAGNVIRFQAQVYKVQTLVDGGIRLTLDLSEQDIATATAMMQVRRAGALLEVAAVAIEKQIGTNGKSELGKREKRKSEWTTAKEQGIN